MARRFDPREVQAALKQRPDEDNSPNDADDVQGNHELRPGRLNMTFSRFRALHPGTKNVERLKASYLNRSGRAADLTPAQVQMLMQAANRRATRNPSPAKGRIEGAPAAPSVGSRVKPGTVPARTRKRRYVEH